jgi:hypothetical protein
MKKSRSNIIGLRLRRMNSFPKHKLIAVSLALIFAAFNIGVPIVIASCPMIEMTRGVACCAMNKPIADGVARITNFADTSCCETKFAAERNSTEFLPIQGKKLDVTTSYIQFLGFIEHQSAIQNPQCRIMQSASPPRSVDIPILVSSLLI